MKKTWIVVLVITFVAFCLRLYRIDFVSLRGDEAFTVVFVQRTWEGLWKGIRTIEPNPPLMYLVLRAWVAMAGASEFVTRYFSAFFGVLCVPLLYRLAREMFSGTVIASPEGAKQSPSPTQRFSAVCHSPGTARQGRCERSEESRKFQARSFVASLISNSNAILGAAPQDDRGTRGSALKHAPGVWSTRNDMIAILAAALIAINPYQIWHSQDVRNYTMWPALSLLALIFFWRWWKLESGDWGLEIGDWRLEIGDLSLYILATLASLYTHYYDTFVLVALNILVVAFTLFERRWRTLARWIVAQAVLVAAYAPWVVWGTNRVTTYGEASAEQSIPLLDQFNRTLATFVLSDTVPDALKSTLWLPLALALLAILVYLARKNRSSAAFLFLYIAVPTLALYVISIGRPLFLERYLNGIAPAYYLTFAVGLAAVLNSKFEIRNSRLRLLPFGFLLLFFVSTSAYALSNYYFDPAYVKAPDWRALAQFIAARQQPGDIVIQNFTEMSAIYYQSGTLPVMTVPKDYYAAPADEKTLQQLNQGYSRIWFIPAAPNFWDPDHFVEKYLARFDDREIDTRVAEFGLQLYLTPRGFSSRIIPINTPIGNALLVGYRIRGLEKSAPQVPKGATETVVLYWRAGQKIAQDHNVFVHLIDASGRVAAQQSSAPVEGAYPTSQWRPGDLIVDAHELQVDAAPGVYSLVAGMDGIATSAPLTQVTITP